MCGICGILNLDDQPVAAEVLHAMTDLLRHRGPDDEGYFLEGGIGLGFRRLAIIDLSGGRQPMANEDGALQVVFNGEIYNFRDLRSQLQQQGHIFQTSSDTEVIVHGYEAWGPEVVRHLNGMFALAVWNRRDRELFLARDRLGIKPLFYGRVRNSLAFASEIKGLLVLPGIEPTVSDQAVFDYFSQHFVPGDKTIYDAIRQLRPGETLLVKDQKLAFARYWRPAVAPDPGRRLEDWCDELRQRLLEAVRLQLEADVPLGVFLSGGLDSSAVTAAMARTGAREIRTFNVGFEAPKYDETDKARAVSQYLGTNHETFRLTSAATDLLPKLLWHLDEPLADATIIPTYLLAQATRRRVTVALSGEGGDELFAGYTQYQGIKLNSWLGLLPRWLRWVLVDLTSHLPRFGSARLGYLGHRLERIAASSLLPLFEGYTRKVAFFTPEMQQRLFSPDFRWQTEDFPYLEEVWSHSPGLPGARSPGPGQSLRPQRLSARRPAGQGGPHEHGLLPGSPGAAARPHPGGVCPSHAHGLEIKTLAHQARAAAGPGALAAAGRFAAVQTRLQPAPGILAPAPPHGLRPGASVVGDLERQRLF